MRLPPSQPLGPWDWEGAVEGWSEREIVIRGFKRIPWPGAGLRPSISQGLEFGWEHTDQRLFHPTWARNIPLFTEDLGRREEGGGGEV